MKDEEIIDLNHEGYRIKAQVRHELKHGHGARYRYRLKPESPLPPGPGPGGTALGED